MLQEQRGSACTTYVYEPDSYVPLARLDRATALVAANDATSSAEKMHVTVDKVFYFHNDVSGMPEELTSAKGELAWQAQYSTWGNTVSENWSFAAQEQIENHGTVPLPQNLRFQGQYLDREIGLHYNTFRFYDPDIGRFISPDPIGLMGGLNLQAYAPNPIGWIDPLGWQCWKTAREKFWKGEAINAAPGRYSPRNLRLMANGNAPKMTINVTYKNTVTNRLKGRVGRTTNIDVPIELHHQHIPQRAGSGIANETWNLTKATPWGHSSMDKHRNLGWDVNSIVKSVAKF